MKQPINIATIFLQIGNTLLAHYPARASLGFVLGKLRQ